MKGTSRVILPLLPALAFVGLTGQGAYPAQPKTATVRPAPVQSPVQAKKVTFLELGSVGCRPCDAMRPVMDSVRQKYGSQVEVTFHDVRKNPQIAQQYRVFLIPTQVFLNGEGREVFRHEGFLALDRVEQVLRQLGVR